MFLFSPTLAIQPYNGQCVQEHIEYHIEQETWLEGNFSAYTASPDETDDNPTIMASGKEVYQGAIACPSKYSFGTKIEIKDFGVYICEDRMGKRYREHENFDIYYENRQNALLFGRKVLYYRVVE